MSVEMRRIGWDVEAGQNRPRERACGLTSFLCKDLAQYILAIGLALAVGTGVYAYYKKEIAIAIDCTILAIIVAIAYGRIGCLKPEADLDDQVERTESRMQELDLQNKLSLQNIRMLEETLSSTKGALEQKIKEIDQLKVERMAQIARVEELLKQLEQTQKEFDQVSTLYNKVKEALKTTESAVSELEQANKSSDKLSDQLKKENSKLSDSEEELSDAVDEMEKGTSSYYKETKELNQLIHALTAQVKRLEEILKRITAEKQALEKAAVEVNRIGQAGSRLEENLKREQELEAKLVKLTEKLAQKYEEYKKLKSDVELLKNPSKP